MKEITLVQNPDKEVRKLENPSDWKIEVVDGTEVKRIEGDNHPEECGTFDTYESLEEGEKVWAQDLFGWKPGVIEFGSDQKPFVKFSENYIGYISFGENCWVCWGSANLKALNRITIKK